MKRWIPCVLFPDVDPGAAHIYWRDWLLIINTRSWMQCSFMRLDDGLWGASFGPFFVARYQARACR